MKTRLLDQLSTSRPLARLQEELENEDSGDDESGQNQDGEANAATETGMKSVTEKEKVEEQEEKPTIRERDESRKERSRSPSKHRKPLLNPHDYELVRVAKVSNFFSSNYGEREQKELKRYSLTGMTTPQILQEIHNRFYKAFDALEGWDPKKALPMSCDVEVRPFMPFIWCWECCDKSLWRPQFIIPEMKAEVLDGCSLVFSGMIPREADPST